MTSDPSEDGAQPSAHEYLTFFIAGEEYAVSLEFVREVMAAYIAKIYEAARAIPSADEIRAFGEENFAALVSVLINTFDGAAMFRHVLEDPDIESRRIPVLMSLLNAART